MIRLQISCLILQKTFCMESNYCLQAMRAVQNESFVLFYVTVQIKERMMKQRQKDERRNLFNYAISQFSLFFLLVHR
jgi:hypothetical protein